MIIPYSRRFDHMGASINIGLESHLECDLLRLLGLGLFSVTLFLPGMSLLEFLIIGSHFKCLPFLISSE